MLRKNVRAINSVQYAVAVVTKVTYM